MLNVAMIWGVWQVCAQSLRTIGRCACTAVITLSFIINKVTHYEPPRFHSCHFLSICGHLLALTDSADDASAVVRHITIPRAIAFELS
jgi:hypothetical protein